MAIFLTEDGRSFLPTARAIWDRLINPPTELRREDNDLEGEAAVVACEVSRRAAEAQGMGIFEELSSVHRQSIARERKKGTHAFAGRRRAIERIGLPQVRAHRLSQLDEDQRMWATELST